MTEANIMDIILQNGPWAAMLVYYYISSRKDTEARETDHKAFIEKVMDESKEREDKLMENLTSITNRFGEISTCLNEIKGDLETVKVKLDKN